MLKGFVVAKVIRGKPTEDTAVTLSLITDLQHSHLVFISQHIIEIDIVVVSRLTTRPIVPVYCAQSEMLRK
jgi:hypothetical protein